MVQYINKAAVVAEIERKLNSYHPTEITSGRYALTDILSFLDTLEVKEVDLEKAIDDYIYTYNGRKRLSLELDWKQCNLTLKGDGIMKFAKHFFELGIKAKGEAVSEDLEEAAAEYLNHVVPFDIQNEIDEGNDPTEIDCYTIDDALDVFKAGARWKENQMQSTIELAEEHAMLAGMNKMEQEMMAKAVDGEVGYWNIRGLSINIKLPRELDLGDKCKVIIIKED